MHIGNDKEPVKFPLKLKDMFLKAYSFRDADSLCFLDKVLNFIKIRLYIKNGAEGEIWTRTSLQILDSESSASTNSATPAHIILYIYL